MRCRVTVIFFRLTWILLYICRLQRREFYHFVVLYIVVLVSFTILWYFT